MNGDFFIFITIFSLLVVVVGYLAYKSKGMER